MPPPQRLTRCISKSLYKTHHPEHSHPVLKTILSIAVAESLIGLSGTAFSQNLYFDYYAGGGFSLPADNAGLYYNNSNGMTGLKYSSDFADKTITYQGFSDTNTGGASDHTYLDLSGLNFSKYSMLVIDTDSTLTGGIVVNSKSNFNYNLNLVPGLTDLIGLYVDNSQTSSDQGPTVNAQTGTKFEVTLVIGNENKGHVQDDQKIPNAYGVYVDGGALTITHQDGGVAKVETQVYTNSVSQTDAFALFANNANLTIERQGNVSQSPRFIAGLTGTGDGTAYGLFTQESLVNLQGHLDFYANPATPNQNAYEIWAVGTDIKITSQDYLTIVHLANIKPQNELGDADGNVVLQGGSLELKSKGMHDASLHIGSSEVEGKNASGYFTSVGTDITLESNYYLSSSGSVEEYESQEDSASILFLVGHQKVDGTVEGNFDATGGTIDITAASVPEGIEEANQEQYQVGRAEIIVGYLKNESSQVTGTVLSNTTLTNTTLNLQGGNGGYFAKATGGDARFISGRAFNAGDGSKVTGTMTAIGSKIFLVGGSGGTAQNTRGGNAILHVSSIQTYNETSQGNSVGILNLDGSTLSIKGGDSNVGYGGAATAYIGDSESKGLTVSGTLNSKNGSVILLTGGTYGPDGAESTPGRAELLVGKSVGDGSVTGEVNISNSTITIKGGHGSDQGRLGGNAHFHVGYNRSEYLAGQATQEIGQAVGIFNITNGVINIIGGLAGQEASEGSDLDSQNSGGYAELHVGESVVAGTKFVAKNTLIYMNSGPEYNNQDGWANIKIMGTASLQNNSQLVINFKAVKGAESDVEINRSLTLGTPNSTNDGTVAYVANYGTLSIARNLEAPSQSFVYGGAQIYLDDGGVFKQLKGTLSIANQGLFTLKEGASIYNYDTINVLGGGTFVISPTEGASYRGGLGTVNVSGLFNAAGIDLVLSDAYPREKADDVARKNNLVSLDKLTIQSGGSFEVGSLGFAKPPKPDYFEGNEPAGYPAFNVQSGGVAAIGTTLAALEDVVLPFVGNIPNTFGGNADTIVQIAQPNGINVSKGTITINPGIALPNTASGQVAIGNAASSTLLVVQAVDFEDPQAPFNLGTTAAAKVADVTTPQTSFTIGGGNQTSVVVLDIDNILKEGTIKGHVSNGFDFDEVSPGTYIVSTNPLYNLAWIPDETDGHLTSAYTITVNEEEKKKESLEPAPSQPPVVSIIAMNMVIDSIWDHGSKLAGYGHDVGDGDLWIDLNWNHSKADYTTLGYRTGYKGDLYGATFGGDYQFTEKFAAGLSFSVGSGNTRGKGITSGTKTDTTYWGITLYAVADTDYANFVGNVSWLKARNKLKGLDSGKPKVYSDVFSAGLRVEKPLRVHENLDIIPHVGVSYLHVRTDSFNYGQFHYDKSKGHFAELPIGVAAMGNFKTDSEWLIKPLLDLQISPTLGRNKVTNRYRIIYFNGPGADGTFDSEVTSRVMYEGKVGINAVKGKHAFGLQFALGLGNNDSRVDTTLMAKYRYSFR